MSLKVKSQKSLPRRQAGKVKRGIIFVVSGPSGSGKTTLVTRLLKDRTIKDKLVKSVSFTTRPKRSSERSGKDYFFVNKEKFKEILKAKKILEWIQYLGYYYATSKVFIEEQIQRGRNIILCLDLKGALRIKKFYRNRAVSIFIMPPSLVVLRQRIERRCSKTKKEEIQRRLELAQKELLDYHRYDYCLVNKDLAQALSKLKEIVLKRIQSEV